jgi:hypothetical protein
MKIQRAEIEPPLIEQMELVEINVVAAESLQQSSSL